MVVMSMVSKNAEGKEIPSPVGGVTPDNKIPIDLKMKNIKDDSKTKKYQQLTLSESILLHGICDLTKKYQNDLDTDEDLLEDEKFQLQSIVNDLRELLEKVEDLY
jgi:hypothetical protein